MTAVLITERSSSFLKRYSRKPLKNAPAPSAITVRSRKIHKPNANRLSMLVSLRPKMRQRAIAYRPSASSTVQGVSHERNRGNEQRRRPRGIQFLSTMRSFIAGQWFFGERAHPRPRRPVMDLRIGAQLLEDTERLRRGSHARNVRAGAVQIAECDRTGRARLRASGHIFAALELRCMIPSVAEIALLDHASHSRRDVRIEGLLHAGGPCRVPPVEVARMVRASRHAIPAPEAALRHLIDDARRR